MYRTLWIQCYRTKQGSRVMWNWIPILLSQKKNDHLCLTRHKHFKIWFRQFQSFPCYSSSLCISFYLSILLPLSFTNCSQSSVGGLDPGKNNCTNITLYLKWAFHNEVAQYSTWKIGPLQSVLRQISQWLTTWNIFKRHISITRLH